MLTQTVTINQNSNPNIIIGRRSTYETQQVIFDVSWLIQTYGEGTAELLIKRPKDASAYPVVAVLDGNTLTWTVSETDTQDKGHGECEIYWYVNGGLAKSCICGITILRDIGDTTETAPDPYETWVETLSRLGAETLTNAQAAEQSANDAAQSASEADNSAAAALESEENALNSENAAKASEQAAAASEQGAEQSATAARQSATEAAQSATNAHDDATDASASADRAEQAAASIEGDTERAEAAAQTAQGAASDASGFAGTASTKATEAAGSSATAEQAAADALASATAADGSASSASASATAAGNAQTAAETAQGKAEDAQEAAETAAQSIEDSAAQIDENTADIADLKSALDTKAGILKDTISGSIASFVPDSTVPNLLGLSVALEPIQDLHGYDSPWPAGGGKNKWNKADFDQTSDYPNLASSYFYSAPLILKPNTGYVFSPTSTASLGVSDYYVVYINQDDSDPDYLVITNPSVRYVVEGGTPKTVTFTTGATGAIRFGVVKTGNPEVPKESALNAFMTIDYQLEEGSTATEWTPYSNICPISGRESVEVEVAGKNLFNPAAKINGYDISLALGIRSSPAWWISDYIPVKGGKPYTFTSDSTRRGGAIFLCKTKGTTAVIAGESATVIDIMPTSAGSTTYTIPIGYNFVVINGLISETAPNIQIELGSTATDYHSYSGTTHTIQLGETVYGGTLDVTNGTLTVDRAMVDLGTLNWTYQSSSGNMYVDNAISDRKFPNCWALCSIFTRFYNQYGGDANGVADVTTNNSFAFQSNSSAVIGRIIVRDTAYTDAAAFKAAMSGVQLAYELATPITIDLDPVQIATIANQTNNVWADAGDVTVEFAADLKTYIDNKIAAAVAALS